MHWRVDGLRVRSLGRITNIRPVMPSDSGKGRAQVGVGDSLVKQKRRERHLRSVRSDQVVFTGGSPSRPRANVSLGAMLRRRYLIALAFVFCLLFGRESTCAQNLKCFRGGLDPIPLWAGKATWTAGGEGRGILLPDPARGSLERIVFPPSPLGGKSAKFIPQNAPGMLSYLRDSLRMISKREREERFMTMDSEPQGPYGIWTLDDGYLVEYKLPWSFVWVSTDLERFREVGRVTGDDGVNPDLNRGNISYSVEWKAWDLAPMPGGGFLAIGDVIEDFDPSMGVDNNFYTTYYFFGLDGELRILSNKEMRVGEERDRHSRLSHLPLIASNQDAGFVLHIGDKVSIGRYEPGDTSISWLKSVPADLASLPLELESSAPVHEQALASLRALESRSAVTGIYAHKKGLYVLVRKPVGRGPGARWVLFSLDPRTGAELFRKILPSEAPHLDLIVGNGQWGLLEKGPVRPVLASSPYMEVRSLVLISEEWVVSKQGKRSLGECEELSLSAPF